MIEVGKYYTTKSGKSVKILRQWPELKTFSASNYLDYNEKGEAFMVLRMSGTHRASHEDLDLTVQQLDLQ